MIECRKSRRGLSPPKNDPNMYACVRLITRIVRSPTSHTYLPTVHQRTQMGAGLQCV